jgi:hypothetical protein
MWSDTVKGTISSSFFIGYTLTNFVGERLGSMTVTTAYACSLKLTCCTLPDWLSNEHILLAKLLQFLCDVSLSAAL